MRLLLIMGIALAFAPCFAKEIHVECGWRVIIEDVKMTVPKGNEFSTTLPEGEIYGVMRKDFTFEKNVNVEIVASDPGGMTLTVPDDMCAQCCGYGVLKLVRCEEVQ